VEALMRRTHPPAFTRTPHLVALVADAERLAASLAGVDVEPERAAGLRREAVLASLRLDGSPADELPDEALLDPDAPPGPAGPTDRPGTWLDAMRVGTGALDAADQATITALEAIGVRTAMAADDLAETLLTAPLEALAELHRRLTRGLLAADAAGRPRTTEQAVHDASVGRILYFPTEPADIVRELHLVAAWLDSVGAREHALVTAGVLHLELLRIHPFEAANGRLARAAARLVLRSRGLDPHGIATIEPELARDPIGYYEEVARTQRRRDLTIWLERWGEAVVDGLRRAAREQGLVVATPPDRLSRFLAGRTGGFTIADYRADAHAVPEDARTDLAAGLDAGLVRRVPGSRGLRYTVT
jgi:Fic family protein